MEQQMYKVQIDGEERSFPAGTTYLQIAGEYQERYPQDIVLVYVNGKLPGAWKEAEKGLCAPLCDDRRDNWKSYLSPWCKFSAGEGSI